MEFAEKNMNKKNAIEIINERINKNPILKEAYLEEKRNYPCRYPQIVGFMDSKFFATTEPAEREGQGTGN